MVTRWQGRWVVLEGEGLSLAIQAVVVRYEFRDRP
jgi:hypothetical protein